MRRRSLCAAGAILLTACAGQSGSPSPKLTASPASSSRGPLLIGSVSVQGDYQISGDFSSRAEMEVGAVPTSAPASSTCTQYASGFGSSRFVAPEVHSGTDPSLYVRATIDADYAGPGTYTNRGSPPVHGDATVSVGSSVGNVFTIYNSRQSGSATLTVAADGSGTLSFSRWGSTESRAGHIAGFLDGTVQWTCR